MMLIFLCLRVTVWSEWAPSVRCNVASVLSIISLIWITRDRTSNGSRGFSRACLGVWLQLCALLAVMKAAAFLGTRLWHHWAHPMLVGEHPHSKGCFLQRWSQSISVTSSLSGNNKTYPSPTTYPTSLNQSNVHKLKQWGGSKCLVRIPAQNRDTTGCKSSQWRNRPV